MTMRGHVRKPRRTSEPGAYNRANIQEIAIAHKLAEAHYALEPGIARIIRLLVAPAREDDPAEPVKLLEVNEDAIADGIRPVFFGARPDKGIPYASVIIEVTPDEYEQIRANPSMLPNNWRLGEELARAAAPVAGR